MRQKESPYLLPEGVFIHNPKYAPATFNSRLSQIILYYIKFDFEICSADFPIEYIKKQKNKKNQFVPRLPSLLEKVEGEVLFLHSKITEVLGGSGYNTEKLATPYVPQYMGKEISQYNTFF